MNLVSAAHGIGQLDFHFEWCPKYRYKMLRQRRFKDLLLQVFEQVAKREGLELLKVGIEDDHVHLVASLRPVHSVSQVFHLLKGASSHALFEAEPKFRLRYSKGVFW